MAEPSFNCPACGESIKLTESLAGPWIEGTRREFEAKIKAKDTDLAIKVASINSKLDPPHSIDTSQQIASSSSERSMTIIYKTERSVVDLVPL